MVKTKTKKQPVAVCRGTQHATGCSGGGDYSKLSKLFIVKVDDRLGLRRRACAPPGM